MRGLPEQLSGVKVFPIAAGTKDPLRGSKGWYDASDDPAQIAKWEAENPGCNWAVACGSSGLFVFDIDPGGLDWWAELQKNDQAIREAVGRAFTVKTPKGGLHVYFKGEGPSTVKKIADGIDTRGGINLDGKIVSGGYVILPGSYTVAGPGRVDGYYEALPGGTINPLPSFLSAIVPKRKQSEVFSEGENPDKDLTRNIQWATDLLQGFVRDGKVAKHGSSDDTTYKIATAVLDKAISPKTCFDLMWKHWVPYAELPIEDWWLEQKIDSAYRYGEQTKTGAKGILPNASAFAHLKGLEGDPAKEYRYKIMSLKEARQDVRPQRWLIPGFLPAEGAAIIYGKTGSYKTFIALDWALCLAHGIAGQWGAAPEKHCVLFLEAENSHALRQERVNSWSAKHNLNPDDAKFYLVDGVPSYGDVKAWKEFEEQLRDRGVNPDLIVIDTLTRMSTGMQENNADDGKLILQRCEELAKLYSCLVLAIGHTGKDLSKGLRGTGVYIDNAVAAHSLKATANGTSLKVEKLKEVDMPADSFYFEKEKLGDSIFLNRVSKASQPDEKMPDRQSRGRADWASLIEVIKVLEGLEGRASTTLLAQEIAGRHGIDSAVVRRKLFFNEELKPLRLDDHNWGIPKQEYDL